VESFFSGAEKLKMSGAAAFKNKIVIRRANELIENAKQYYLFRQHSIATKGNPLYKPGDRSLTIHDL
jgi:hypothetical protein